MALHCILQTLTDEIIFFRLVVYTWCENFHSAYTYMYILTQSYMQIIFTQKIFKLVSLPIILNISFPQFFKVVKHTLHSEILKEIYSLSPRENLTACKSRKILFTCFSILPNLVTYDKQVLQNSTQRN